jgi:F-type H+-transporting ATPase subunit b
MKPLARKGLLIIVVLYAVTIGLMIANFLERAKPAHPQEVTQRVQEHLNEILAWAHEADPEHIREPQQPITAPEAAKVRDDLLAKKGLIININYTLIMQCLNFAVLLLVLYAWLWDPMLRFLDKRRALVKERLDEAAASREKAASLRDERQQELNSLRQERGQIIEQARALGEQEREEIVERARREAERIMRQTEERLGEESRRARVALREEVAELATYIASRMLKREISRQDHDRLIEEVTQGMVLDAREKRPEAGGNG